MTSQREQVELRRRQVPSPGPSREARVDGSTGSSRKAGPGSHGFLMEVEKGLKDRGIGGGVCALPDVDGRQRRANSGEREVRAPDHVRSPSS